MIFSLDVTGALDVKIFNCTAELGQMCVFIYSLLGLTCPPVPAHPTVDSTETAALDPKVLHRHSYR